MFVAGSHRQQRHRRGQVHAIDPALGLRDVPQRARHSLRRHGDPRGPEGQRRLALCRRE